MTYELPDRPLTALELLDSAILLVVRRLPLYLTLAALGAAPALLLAVGYVAWLETVVEGTSPLHFYTGTFAFAVGMTVGWGWNCVVRAWISSVTLTGGSGSDLDLRQSWRRALRAAPASLLAGWGAIALCIPGLLLFIYPGAALLCSWYAARPAALEEDLPLGAALRRSRALSRGHRGRAFALWLMLLLGTALLAINLHLALVGLLDLSSFLLGLDTAGARAQTRIGNELYLAFLCAAALLAIEPVKTTADVLYYHDLRVRREGGDLLRRVAALRASLVLPLLLAFLPSAGMAASSPGAAEYARRAARLRRQIEQAKTPGDLDGALLRDLTHVPLAPPSGRPSHRNDWLDGAAAGMKRPAERQALIARLRTLERIAAPAPAVRPSLPSGAGETRQMLKSIMHEPRFRPLADRPELDRLTDNVRIDRVGEWQRGFLRWIFRTLFPEREAVSSGAGRKRVDFTGVAYVSLAAALLLLITLLLRWLALRAGEARGRTVGGAAAAPPLSASLTEDALRHSGEDWRRFARDWSGQGDLRQAIRSLYLATLVHLHDSGIIRYHRALTNWAYVRQFRGDPESRAFLRRLTEEFDEIWYGGRPCDLSRYEQFHALARRLGAVDG